MHNCKAILYEEVMPINLFENLVQSLFKTQSSSHTFLKPTNGLGSHRSDCSYQFLFITSAIDQLTTDWWLSFHFNNERNYHHYSMYSKCLQSKLHDSKILLSSLSKTSTQKSFFLHLLSCTTDLALSVSCKKRTWQLL